MRALLLLPLLLAGCDETTRLSPRKPVVVLVERNTGVEFVCQAHYGIYECVPISTPKVIEGTGDNG
jgi:hypothetical protein